MFPCCELHVNGAGRPWPPHRPQSTQALLAIPDAPGHPYRPWPPKAQPQAPLATKGATPGALVHAIVGVKVAYRLAALPKPPAPGWWESRVKAPAITVSETSSLSAGGNSKSNS